MSNIIEAENLRYAYVLDDEEVRFALAGVSLTIAKGEFVAVLGHNGSGKSTLARHINVLLTPQEGKLIVDGMDTADADKVWDIRSRAGMVFQNPDNQIVSTIVEEDVAFGPENLGVPQPEIVERVNEALKMVDMENMGKRAPHMLSGGQKQRIAIAGVLAMHPEIIVFDEPTAMLDPQGRQEVMDTIRMLNKEQGKTIVLITHYMEEAAECGRVFVLEKGKLVDEGTPGEVFAHTEKLRKAGLMPPFATQVAERLAQNGIKLGRTPVKLEELVEELCRLQ